jgi:putative transposase
LGRSRGGLSTKIHMLCDALGLPLKFILTPGQSSDFKEALPLLKDEKANYVLADKGYDSTEIVDYIEKKIQAEVVIPSKSSRKIQRGHDQLIYRERNIIERLFNKLKQFRRIATRYDKLKLHFQAFTALACAWIWLT